MDSDSCEGYLIARGSYAHQFALVGTLPYPPSNNLVPFIHIVFELLDHEKNVSYWVKEVPTPQQAQMLLEEHGELPEKWEQSSS